MMVNWDSYKRKQINIDKAIPNPVVSSLLSKHYQYLSSLLVKSESDQEIFNDTYLKLTYCYQSHLDFIQQFKYYFNLLKGAYYRDDKVTNYYIQIGITDKDDRAYIPDTDLQPTLKDTPSLPSLKQTIQEYAISKKAYKPAKKIDK